MTSIIPSPPAQASQQLTASTAGFQRPAPTGDQVADAKELRSAFTQFVGTTVFGQMLSSMRSTVGEPAYFHGGQAEKMFQSQLDHALADEMTQSGASPFAQSLFSHQFPKQAEMLRQAEAAPTVLDQLTALPRR